MSPLRTTPIKIAARLTGQQEALIIDDDMASLLIGNPPRIALTYIDRYNRPKKAPDGPGELRYVEDCSRRGGNEAAPNGRGEEESELSGDDGRMW